MRYIGNKTKLLGFIGSVLDSLRLKGGTAADPFAGTASVAQYLKSRGFATASSDIMTYSYVLQRAYVQLDCVPTFDGVLDTDRELAAVLRRSDFRTLTASRFQKQEDLFGPSSVHADCLHQLLTYLDSFLDPVTAFVSRNFSAPMADRDSAGDRMFFTVENGRRIDAIRTKLHEWRVAGVLPDDEYYLLLTCLIEAADGVANTTGVYAAFVKSWQSNALKPLRLTEPELVVDTGLNCTASQQDANEFVRRLGFVDVLYLDPPYNTRQYSSYYHVPELIARGWFDEEPTLRGKTGLIPDADKKSKWSVPGECVEVFRDLIRNARARYVLLSYNNEGIIPPDAVEDVFVEFGTPGTFHKHAVDYARYRSDRDHEQRVYKGDVVTEFVYTVELAGPSNRALADLKAGIGGLTRA
jgi:adenine-specific DNA-methyltransferase